MDGMNNMDKLTPQVPAVGIMLQGEWKNATSYMIPCECSDPDHAQYCWIEADSDHGITVTTYTTQTLPIWSTTDRLKLIWKLLTGKSVTYDATLVLNEQAAVNYASALTTTMDNMRKARESDSNAD